MNGSQYLRALALLFIAAFCFSCDLSTPNRVVSDGSRIGVVVKFSLKEASSSSSDYVPPRCWEGELNMTLPGSSAPETWLFSVPPDDSAAVEEVKVAMRSRKTVEVHYRQWLYVPSEPGGCVARPRQGTTYAVYDVTPADGSEAER